MVDAERAERILSVECHRDLFVLPVGYKGIRQEQPVCCGRTVPVLPENITDDQVKRVGFRTEIIGGEKYSLIKPVCPLCGKRQSAVFNVVS